MRRTELSGFQYLSLPRLQVDCTWFAAESRDFIAVVATPLRQLRTSELGPIASELWSFRVVLLSSSGRLTQWTTVWLVTAH